MLRHPATTQARAPTCGPACGRAPAWVACVAACLLALHLPAAQSAQSAQSAQPARAQAQDTGRFGFYGLSPAAAGQARAAAEAALGEPLLPAPLAAARAASAARAAASAQAASAPPAAAACQHRLAAGRPGVRFVLVADRITRVETRDARWATVSGLHVGDDITRAQKLYGKRLQSTPHPYFDRGRVLTVVSPDRAFALVMEANDQGRIITLRGGRLPDVAWLEGCP